MGNLFQRCTRTRLIAEREFRIAHRVTIFLQAEAPGAVRLNERQSIASLKSAVRVSSRGLQRENGWRTLKESRKTWFIRNCKIRLRCLQPLPFNNQGDKSDREQL